MKANYIKLFFCFYVDYLFLTLFLFRLKKKVGNWFFMMILIP